MRTEIKYLYDNLMNLAALREGDGQVRRRVMINDLYRDKFET